MKVILALAGAAVLASSALIGIGTLSPALAKGKRCDECFARVASDGTLLNNDDVDAAERVSTGVYSLSFKKPAKHCAITATAVNTPAFVSVAILEESDDIFFNVQDAEGTLVDSEFSVAVTC